MVTIVQKEDPVLRGIAQEVGAKEFGTPGLKKILRDMSEAMEKEEDGAIRLLDVFPIPIAHVLFQMDGMNKYEPCYM